MHNIFQQRFVASDEAGWHERGITYKGDLTFEKAWELANMPVEVVSRQALYLLDESKSAGAIMPDGLPNLRKAGLLDEDHRPVRNSGFRIILSRDADGTTWPLGQASEIHKNIQREHLHTCLKPLLDAGCRVETTLSLDYGRKWIVLLRLEEDISVGGQKYTSYLMASVRLDAKGGLHLQPTMIRVVCENTEQMALAGHEKYLRIYHKGDVIGKCRDAAAVIEEGYKLLQERAVTLAEMLVVKIKPEDNAKILSRVFGWGDPREWTDREESRRKSRLTELGRIFEQSLGLEPTQKNTLYHLHNTLTQWTDHQWGKGRKLDALLTTGNQWKERSFLFCKKIVEANGEVKVVYEERPATDDELQEVGASEMRDLLKSPVKTDRD